MGLKTSIEQEKIVFAYMLKRPQYLLHVDKDFFSNDDIQYIASSAKQFFKEYKETPSCEQMKAILKDDKKEIKNAKLCFILAGAYLVLDWILALIGGLL